jgi:hypothetical protein
MYAVRLNMLWLAELIRSLYVPSLFLVSESLYYDNRFLLAGGERESTYVIRCFSDFT